MKKFRIENRSRSKIRLQTLRPAGVKDAPAVHDIDNDLVIGDAADTDELLELKGIARGPRCPSPVLVVTDVQLGKLAPSSKALFDSLQRPTQGKAAIATWGKGPVLVVSEVA